VMAKMQAGSVADLVRMSDKLRAQQAASGGTETRAAPAPSERET
jgi:hypothetical protein